MRFRDRLIATLKAIAPVLEEEGVLVVGSELPNLLQEEVASTLVVSQDVDIGVPVQAHAAVKRRLRDVRGLRPSAEEPSVWVPESQDLLEVNFVGIDENISDASETYVLEDSELPLMVFGPLSFMRPGTVLDVEGARVPLPRPAGSLLEKLVTDRSGIKGDRDLLVVLGLLLTAGREDLDELVRIYGGLAPHMQHTVLANLTILSLMDPMPDMPNPQDHRASIHELLARLEPRTP